MKTVSAPAGVHFMMRLCGMSAKSRKPERIQIGPSVHLQSSASFSIFAPAGTMASRPGSALSTEPTVSNGLAVSNAVEFPSSLLASAIPIDSNPAIQGVFMQRILQQFCLAGAGWARLARRSPAIIVGHHQVGAVLKGCCHLQGV